MWNCTTFLDNPVQSSTSELKFNKWKNHIFQNNIHLLKIWVLQYVMPCYRLTGSIYCEDHTAFKISVTTDQLHGITNHKTWICSNTAVWTSNLATWIHVYHPTAQMLQSDTFPHAMQSTQKSVLFVYNIKVCWKFTLYCVILNSSTSKPVNWNYGVLVRDAIRRVTDRSSRTGITGGSKFIFSHTTVSLCLNFRVNQPAADMTEFGNKNKKKDQFISMHLHIVTFYCQICLQNNVMMV
jgi:hypothetical protein